MVYEKSITTKHTMLFGFEEIKDMLEEAIFKKMEEHGDIPKPDKIELDLDAFCDYGELSITWSEYD